MSNAELLPDGGKRSLTKAPDEAAIAPRDLYPQNGRYPASFDEGPDLAETVREYIRILTRRKWLVLSILGIVTTLGTLYALLSTPLYTSTVRLQIDRNVAKVVEDGNVTPVEGTDTEFLRTQYELLQSRNLAERVTSATSLVDDEDFLKAHGFSLLGAVTSLFKSSPKSDDSNQAAVARRAVNRLKDNLAVRPVPGSRLVDLSYTDPSPPRAQRIAAAFAEAFIASTLDKRFEANSYAKVFLEDQLKQLKFRTEESEKTLIAFGEKEEILELTDKSSIVDNNLAAANAALGSLIAERIKNEQLWKQVEQAEGLELPQLLNNGVVDGLRTKRNELVTEYQEKLETFKPQYPAMIEISRRIAEIDRQLATEIKTIRMSLKAAYESSLNQENETKQRIDTLKAEALDLQKRSIQYNTLKREVETNRGLYNGLLQRYKEVNIAGGVGANNIFVVDKAQIPQSPTSPNILRALMLSIVLGLGAGIGAAIALEKLDDVIVSAEEVERLSGLSSLGIIPRSRSGAEGELINPRSPLSEAYRSLCTSLQFTTEHGLPRSLAITSSGPGEGKSLTSVAIGQHFARMGLKVLLIDADLRNPSVHKKLQLDNSVGLSNYLTGACTPPEAFQKTDLANLAIMSSGPLPPNAADLLSGARLASLLSGSLEVFDFVIIDGPPMLGLADAVLLSSAAEATILVVGAGQARRAAVAGALKRLEFSRSPMIGFVLTKFDAKKAGYGYGYGSYGYGNYTYAYGGQLNEQQVPPPLIGESASRTS